MSTADVYAYWRAACRGSTEGVPLLPTIYPPPSNDNPQAGLWKTKLIKDGPFVPMRIWLADSTGTPVHVWRDDLTLTATIDGQPVKMERIERVWHFLKPCTKDEMAHYDANKQWPGDAPTIGDNSKNYGDGFDGIKEEINDYAAMCKEFLAQVAKAGGIKTKVEADKAKNMADAIGNVKNGLARKADTLRTAEVQPHLDAQRDINAKYNPLVDLGKNTAVALKYAAEQWLTAETKRLQEIENDKARKAQAAADAKAKADREAWEREQVASRKTAPSDGELLEAPPPPAPAPAIVPEKVKVQIGGQRGAKRSLRTVMVAKVTDHAAALAHFAQAPQVIELIQALAQKAIDAKMPTPPGVEVVEETRL